MSQFEQIKEQLSLGGDYAAVAAKYRPIFAEIAQRALAREQQRILPFEQIEQLKQALNPEGEILCCHWRHDIQDFELNAQKVHQGFQQSFPFHHYLSLNDPDFMVDVWTVNPSSIAQREQLR